MCQSHCVARTLWMSDMSISLYCLGPVNVWCVSLTVLPGPCECLMCQSHCVARALWMSDVSVLMCCQALWRSDVSVSLCCRALWMSDVSASLCCRAPCRWTAACWESERCSAEPMPKLCTTRRSSSTARHRQRRLRLSSGDQLPLSGVLVQWVHRV